MKRLIYLVLTLVSAMSLGGCSSPITSTDLTMIEEAESQNKELTAPTLTTERDDEVFVAVNS